MHCCSFITVEVLKGYGEFDPINISFVVDIKTDTTRNNYRPFHSVVVIYFRYVLCFSL